MSGSFSASSAAVTVSMWRNEIGHVVSTIVGKVSIDLVTGAPVSPLPIATNDLPATDPRFVLEANEAVPFTECASILVYGGPIGLTLHGAQGAVTASASARAPVGYGVASPERACFAPEPPRVGIDGLTTVSDDLDGRFFVAAPGRHRFGALRGDESLFLDIAGTQSSVRLPGVTIVATVQADKALRVVALTPDMVVVHGRRISIVSRAIVRGSASLLSAAVVATADLKASDRGDPRPRMGEAVRVSPRPDAWPFGRERDTVQLDPSSDDTAFESQTVVMGDTLRAAKAALAEQTADMSRAELASLRAPSTPFGATAPPAEQGALQVPATPFDRGFAPTHVVPAQGVLSTLSPDDEMAKRLALMRAELRKAPPDGPQAASAVPPKSRPK